MLVTVRSLNSPKSNKLIVLEEVHILICGTLGVYIMRIWLKWIVMYTARGICTYSKASISGFGLNWDFRDRAVIEFTKNVWITIARFFLVLACAVIKVLLYLCIDARLALFMVGYLKLRWILEWPLHLVLLWAISIQFLQYWQTYILLHFCISWTGIRKKQNWISDFFHGVNYLIEHIQSVYREKSKTCTLLGQLRRW